MTAGGAGFYAASSKVAALPPQLKSVLEVMPLHFGRLPGDIMIMQKGYIIYIPLSSVALLWGLWAGASKLRSLYKAKFGGQAVAEEVVEDVIS